MRTTVTLDDDVAEKLQDLAHRQKTSFKTTLNAVLRQGLAPERAAAKKRFRVITFDGAFAPGIDLGKLNQLVDELETGDFLKKEKRA